MDIEDSPSSPKKPKTDDGDASVASVSSDICLNVLEVSEAHKSTEHVLRSEELLKTADYEAAEKEANKVLEDMPSLPTIAKAALNRGKAMVSKAMKQMSETGEEVPEEVFEKIWSAFQLSGRLNPECQETMEEMDTFSAFLRDRPFKHDDGVDYDVIVVGAGCSGIGTAVMLTQTFGLDTSRVLIVERGEEVGESFRRWPMEMRFISPSFNQQGWTDSFDLNSISHGTSPAFSLHIEHPTGMEYAAYLKAITKLNELQVRTSTEVECIRPVGNPEEEEGRPKFSVDVRTAANEEEGTEAKSETLTSRYIVWAAGEFQYPHANMNTVKTTDSVKTMEIDGEEKKSEEQDSEAEAMADVLAQEKERIADEDDELRQQSNDNGLRGAEFCRHNSTVGSWKYLEGDDFIIIGGYESGLDACVNLAKAGKRAKVLASTPCWDVKTADPSIELAPYTANRLREVTAPDFSPQPQMLAPIRVVSVEKAEGGGYNVTAEWQEVEEVEDAPLREPIKVSTYHEPGEPGTTITLHTPNPPILATGFEGSVRAAASHLFAFADENHKRAGCLGNAPLLTDDDESTKVPGVFLVGPQVQHDSLVFCFVYKFRQRFGVVANAICQGLGMDTKAAKGDCRSNNMYLDNFETCEDTCGDVC
ncbi:unnamed protein product [Discosporangium mesarthrocarpum]